GRADSVVLAPFGGHIRRLRMSARTESHGKRERACPDHFFAVHCRISPFYPCSTCRTGTCRLLPWSPSSSPQMVRTHLPAARLRRWENARRDWLIATGHVPLLPAGGQGQRRHT